jgi:hypothetical protein
MAHQGLAVPLDHLAVVESAAVAVAEVTGLGEEGRGMSWGCISASS